MTPDLEDRRCSPCAPLSRPDSSIPPPRQRRLRPRRQGHPRRWTPRRPSGPDWTGRGPDRPGRPVGDGRRRRVDHRLLHRPGMAAVADVRGGAAGVPRRPLLVLRAYQPTAPRRVLTAGPPGHGQAEPRWGSHGGATGFPTDRPSRGDDQPSGSRRPCQHRTTTSSSSARGAATCSPRRDGGLADRDRRDRPLRRHLPEPRLHPVEDVRARPPTPPAPSGRPAASACTPTSTGVDWPAIRDRVFGRIDPIHDRRCEYRRRSGVDVLPGDARFVGPQGARGRRRRAARRPDRGRRRIRPDVPPIPGTRRRRRSTPPTRSCGSTELPASMLVIGGGFIAAEMGHVFEALGTEVTIVQRGPRLLGSRGPRDPRRFTERLRATASTSCSTAASTARATPRGVDGRRSRRADGSAARSTPTCVLPPRAGVPNSDLLDVGRRRAQRRRTRPRRHRRHLPHQRHRGLGPRRHRQPLPAQAHGQRRDPCRAPQSAHPDTHARRPFDVVPTPCSPTRRSPPSASPRTSSASSGRPYVVVAARLRRHRLRLGARGHDQLRQAARRPRRPAACSAPTSSARTRPSCIQPLIQAMCLGNTVDQLAHDVFYIHPALTEVVEQALLDL